MTTEEWRPVAGYEGLYEVSNLGRLRSWWGWRGKRADQPHALALPLDNRGYVRVTLCGSSGRRRVRMQDLVLETFVGPKPNGLVIRHLDGNATNNDLGNLSYGTWSENVQDSVRHGTHHQVAKTHCPQGHVYDEENTMIARRVGRAPQRQCRACTLESYRRYKLRKKARSADEAA